MGFAGDVLTLKEGFVIVGLLGCATSAAGYFLIKRSEYFAERISDLGSPLRP
jgi:hypothetical protein